MENKKLTDYNSKDLYNLFSCLYKEKYAVEYKGAGFIGNEFHLLKVAIDANGADQIACAMLNCVNTNKRKVNIPYFIAGLKYYTVSYNTSIYFAVTRYGDNRIKKLWRHFIMLDSVWFPKVSQKEKSKEIYNEIKKWANEKVNKKKRKIDTKSNKK